MNNLNRYISNQRTYVDEKQKQPLTGFSNQKGDQATWRDIAVTFTYSWGTKVNFLFNNLNQPNASIRSTLTQDDRLGLEEHQLIFAYTLDVLNEKISDNNKKAKVTASKQLISALNDNIASSSIDEIQRIIDNMKTPSPLTSFFNWLHKHKMLPVSCIPVIPTVVKSTRTMSSDDALNAEKNKLPDEKVLLALGAIFNDVIPQYTNEDRETFTNIALHHRDSFTCTMAALAMASPNRVTAEQTLLTKQRIQSHIEKVEEKNETIHYLNWCGSKGFKDYQNHINTEIAESLDRALHYTALVTEPARALARFYNAPSLALKYILGDFQPSIENMTQLKPTMNKPINLIHLGLLLGFFEGTNKCVRVTADTKGAIDVSTTNPVFIKPIQELSTPDKLVFMSQCPYAHTLTGSKLTSKQQIKKLSVGKKELTVSEFQKHYIAMNQSKINGYNKANTRKVDFENALFAYTQKQLANQAGAPFLLKPISSLGQIFSEDCKKAKGKTLKTIFERFSFTSDFAITPHQFRHWHNDYLAKKGLPHLLITMLSGRKSAEQTLTYIHTTNAQNASVISDILYPEEVEDDIQEKVGKRIQSKVQYDEAINNLSPTFISEVGFCTQDLTLTPCTYMTEFETQCTLCSSSCHIAHDNEAIDLLKKDFEVQKHNLKQVQEAINFVTSDGKQLWYQTHYRNTYMLKNLIEVLSDKSIKEGTIVRFLTRSNVMRITDLETKTVTELKLSLPNEKKALQDAIEAANQPVGNSAKNNFLGFLGKI
ncbi:hypothetical protein [Vibrio splendidus]|uniref:hypothetical protein n=1 Tax=Vibrio splendidus TaxID=29497 RepID=UPI000C85C87D|nr:hypothetical protein [Vibrio splendidus]PMI30628.1 hypothetical protein BCU48_09170 [Vibrio splendidus]